MYSAYNVAKILLSALILLAIVVPLSDAQVEEQSLIKTVVVIGTGAIYKGDSASAREAAVSGSLILAVDMVTVEILPIESIARNFKAINEIIYSQTGEFIQGYKVLAESFAEKQYRVMVQAAVSIKALEDKLLEAGIMVAKKALPKTLFLVAEQHFEDNLLNYWWHNNFYHLHRFFHGVWYFKIRPHQKKFYIEINHFTCKCLQVFQSLKPV